MEAVGPEAFELGLLMGTESDPLEEEQAQVYTFHHLMLLEYTASKCVARMPKVRDTTASETLIRNGYKILSE